MKENKNIDYVSYIDTDSLFLPLEDWLFNQGISKDKWEKLSDEEKVDILLKVSKIIENYVNDKSYDVIQVGQYNSQVPKDYFSIVFKQELVAKTLLFTAKKKYAYNVLNEEGTPTDKIKVTGLEIIRSETPTVFKNPLEHILEMILKEKSDKEILKQVRSYKKSIKKHDPEEVSANIGVNNINKYIDENNNHKKGTPFHVKGVANYRKLINILGLEDRYKDIQEGEKAHVCYVKPNPHNIDVVTFDEWPNEFFSVGIEPDISKQINKFFVKKIEMLLEPMNKKEILDQGKSAFGAFIK